MIGVLLSLLSILHATQETTENPTLRLIPESAISARDHRPLTLLQSEFLSGVLDVEDEARELEKAIATAEGDEKRLEQIELDSKSVAQLRDFTSFNRRPSTISSAPLTILDLFLYEFATDRLTSEVYDVRVLEAWSLANQKFLNTGSMELRNLAIRGRAESIRAMRRGAVLFRVIVLIESGRLTEAERHQLLALLQLEFPDAPLPLVEVATSTISDAGGPVFPSLSTLPLEQALDLPLLDGVEKPLGVLPNLTSLFSTMKSG